MKKLITLIICFVVIGSQAQDTLKGTFVEYQPGFYENEIRPDGYDAKDGQVRTFFSADLTDMEYPTDPELYSQRWHFPPLSQGSTGTCWCFATVSFLESEVKRITDEEIKLSEMYIVYWEYVERARAFVEERGDVYFAQGSEATSVPRIMKKYGIVPAEDYPGLPKERKYHNHTQMVKEMSEYLENIKRTNSWNTVMVVSTIREILNTYMGTPPQKVFFDGDYYTPVTFMNNVLKINPDDYFSFMSTMSQTYNQKGELIEPDNWWHCDDYYNVMIDDFLLVIDDALDSSYTICICGDVSEPGYNKWLEVGIIPSFDIPSELIDESAREMRLQNKTTTDDHCIHIIGVYEDEESKDRWYMIKDSGAGGFDGPNKGYRFLHEDYIRLKMMNIMVHKEAGRTVLEGIIK